MSTMPDAPDSLFIQFQAALVGRYSLERELGRGGMGVVYLAREVRLDRLVAIKLLPPARASDAKLRERFLREARTAAKLSHPHIIPIFTVDEVGAFVFFAMAYVAGKAAQVLAKQVTEPAPPLASVAPGVPRRIAQAIDRCLAKDPADRPASGENVAELLGVALEQRRELPVGLRVFVKRNARLGGAGGLIYVLSIPFLMAIVGSLFGRTGGEAALWTFAAAVTVVPLGILVSRARRFLVSGFGPEELAVAFRTELEQGREERIFEYGRGPSLYERVLRLLGVGGIAIGTLSGLILFNTPPFHSASWRWVAQLVGWAGTVGGVSSF